MANSQNYWTHAPINLLDAVSMSTNPSGAPQLCWQPSFNETREVQLPSFWWFIAVGVQAQDQNVPVGLLRLGSRFGLLVDSQGVHG